MKKRLNFSRRLFFAYSTALLAVLALLFAFVILFVYQEQYQRSAETQIQLMDKTAEQLDSSIRAMDRIVNGLLFDKAFLTIMEDPEAALHYTNYSTQVLNRFVALDAPTFSTHRIIAFNRELYYTMSKTGENQSHIKAALASYPWWNEVVAARGQKVVLPPHQDSFDLSEHPVYSVARAITESGRYLGVIEVQNSYQQLSDFCALDARMGALAVFNVEGKLVYPVDADEHESAFLAELFAGTTSQAATEGSFTVGRCQASYTRSNYSGWTTVIYSDVSGLVPYALELMLLCFLAFLLMGGACLLLIHVITKRLTAPLLDLNKALAQVSLDNLSLTLPDSHGIVEIESINSSFEAMFTHLKKAIAQNVQSRANEERANYLALQSQMNPHTIYNTITMIESVSYMHGDREVSNLCICFSRMLRYISDYTKREYTVKDELNHLKDYAVLITKRYEGKLDIATFCVPGLELQMLPKFTIQPLVENSVKHGFGAGCDKLMIHINVEHTPGGWRIMVRDSGQGFPVDRLEELSRQFAHCDNCLKVSEDVVNQKIGNLALSNIYVRCRLLYGERFHINVGNNTDGSGGFVDLNIFWEEEDA